MFSFLKSQRPDVAICSQTTTSTTTQVGEAAGGSSGKSMLVPWSKHTIRVFFFPSLIVFLRLRREFPLFSQLLPTIFKISKNTKIQDALLLTSFRGGPATIDITNTIPCWCRPAPSVCPSETYRRLLCDLNSWEGEKEKEVEEE